MKRIKTSLILNIIITFLIILASTFMFLGIKFMPGKTLLEVSKIGMLKFYTADSNILMGVASLIFAIYEIKLLKKKVKKIPKSIYIFKFIATSAITLTFLVTAIFLAPLYGFDRLYNNNNLFFHLIIPVLSIITYIFYEKHENKYSYAIYGLIPMFIYSIYYASRILIHLNSGGLTFKYDFYGFLQGNVNNIFIIAPVIYLTTYLISLFLIFFNKKLSKTKMEV